jgi:hypothetical protein
MFGYTCTDPDQTENEEETPKEKAKWIYNVNTSFANTAQLNTGEQDTKTIG